MSRILRVTSCAAALLIAAPMLALGFAQQSSASPAQAPRRGLRIDDVIRDAIAHGAEVQRARLALDAGRGRLIEAAGPFDTQLSLAVHDARTTASQFLADNAPTATVVEQSTTAYTLGLSRRLRSGVLIEPQMNVERTTSTLGSPLEYSAGDVRLRLQVPLLRDRGGQGSAGVERAARVSFAAEGAMFHFAVASAVRDAVNAYWAYLASVQAVGIYRNTEERARRMVEEIRVLVRANERPTADLNQVLASLSGKSVSRLAAEQDVVVAWATLRLLTGADPMALRNVLGAATPFPEGQDFTPDSATMQRAAIEALERRDDLRASRSRVTAAGALERASESDAKPALDLVTTLGYSTLMRSGGGIDAFVSPLARNIPGMNASVGLAYRLPTANSAAAGRMAQQRAFSGQQRAATDELERLVISNVISSSIALSAGTMSLQESTEAVRLQRQALADERSRYDLGASTVISVLLTEDELTSAQLAAVAARLRYARAIAALRFAEGRILTADRTKIEVYTAGLLAP